MLFVQFSVEHESFKESLLKHFETFFQKEFTDLSK